MASVRRKGLAMRWTRSAGQDAKIEGLRRVPLLRGCRAEELKRLAASGELVRFPAGTVLQADGDEAVWLHLVIAGEVAGGRDERSGPGTVLGDKEALSG